MELIFTHHGQSEWNTKNLFTDWCDMKLSEQGLTKVAAAGRKLKGNGYEFDIALTSVPTHAVKACNIVLEEFDQLFVPQAKAWWLNERHHDQLQGLDKKQTTEKYGNKRVHIWRHSYNTLPPLLDPKDPFSAHNGRRYASLPNDAVPDGEGLKITLERVLPFRKDQTTPTLLNGKRVLVAAHGNSLHALAEHIEDIPDADITGPEIPTGQSLAYKLDNDLKVVEKFYL